MEYVPGISLKKYMKQQQELFSEQETLTLMQPILIALQAMHQKGILHRDISPENLMLSPDNTLTLIDLPNADASSGNSLLSTIMQLSIAVSIAAASLLLDSFGGHSATSGKAVEAAFHATFVTIGAIAAASSFIFALVDKNKGITRRRKKAASYSISI